MHLLREALIYTECIPSSKLTPKPVVAKKKRPFPCKYSSHILLSSGLRVIDGHPTHRRAYEIDPCLTQSAKLALHDVIVQRKFTIESKRCGIPR